MSSIKAIRAEIEKMPDNPNIIERCGSGAYILSSSTLTNNDFIMSAGYYDNMYLQKIILEQIGKLDTAGQVIEMLEGVTRNGYITSDRVNPHVMEYVGQVLKKVKKGEI